MIPTQDLNGVLVSGCRVVLTHENIEALLQTFFICFFKRLKNCLINNDAGSGSGSFIFHRLGVVIQKGVGAQLVARLPTKNSVI